MTNPFAQPTPPVTGGPRFDHCGRYLVTDPVTGKDVPTTRVTTFAKSVSDTFAISLWSQRMAVKGITMDPKLLRRAKNMSLENREGFNKIVAEAKEKSGASTRSKLGTMLHSLTEMIDLDPSAEIPDEYAADVKVYLSTLKSHGIETIPEYIERRVTNSEFAVAGTFDRIVRMPDGSLRIADLKTGATLKYSWKEITIQLMLYAWANLIWDDEFKISEPMPKVDPNLGLVIHLPAGENKCSLYDVNLREGYLGAKLCVEVQNWRGKGGEKLYHKRKNIS